METTYGKNYLGVVDYLVVGATLLFSLFIGVYQAVKGRNVTNTEELLTGSRQMGAIPVAASMLVSYLSAITILGYPAEVYSYGSQVFLLTIMGPVTTIIAIYLFVGVMYELKLTSAYKYLEYRFDSIAVRWMGSLIFIVQLLLISGIVMYAPAIALETMMGLPVWISVIGIAICGTIYTSIGGIKAVVWTDVFQFGMIFIGMSAIVFKAVSKAGGFANAFEIAEQRGRLELFNWTVDPFMRHNSLNILLGSGFGGLFFVVHQPVVQRYCSLPTFKDAVKSILWSSIFGLLTVALVILTGVVIFAAYADCDPLTSGQIRKADQIVPFFVIKELAYIPGMMGLFAAVVFSAVLSTISSTLNSLAAVTWEDFLVKISCFRNMGDLAQATTYKILSILYGLIIVVLAFYAEHLGSIFQAAITVVTTAVSIQGSVFLMGIFLSFVNKIGALVGMITGIILMGFLSVNSFILQLQYSFQPKLNFSTEECSDEIYMEYGVNGTLTGGYGGLLPATDLGWPAKLFTVSYILYPLIGGVITISTSIIFSLMTGGRHEAYLVKPEYLHPLVRPRRKNKVGVGHFNNNNSSVPKITKITKTEEHEKVNMGFIPEPEVPKHEEAHL